MVSSLYTCTRITSLKTEHKPHKHIKNHPFNYALSAIYLMIAHLPVGPLSIGHDLPHHNAKAPDVAGRSELPVCYGFWSRPANRDFPSLRDKVRGQRSESAITSIIRGASPKAQHIQELFSCRRKAKVNCVFITDSKVCLYLKAFY